ncbi:MAG: flavin reductase family protein [Planctomycetota bacterium]|jgi:flavin reductase (DIM6/NTAB) family NADH-FMN oxidoreductase RutF
MQIEAAGLSPRESYHLLISVVLPRPIAWMSTVDAEGRPNLAPFSFFGGVTASPPTVMVSIGRRKGRPKDTAANLLATREAVVHVPHRALAERMVATSAEAAADVSEFDLAGLTAAPATDVRPARVEEAAVAMEAVVDRHLEIGDGPVDLFLLRILRFHVADELLVDGLPDPARLRAVGRLGGSLYCDTTAPFAVARPD